MNLKKIKDNDLTKLIGRKLNVDGVDVTILAAQTVKEVLGDLEKYSNFVPNPNADLALYKRIGMTESSILIEGKDDDGDITVYHYHKDDLLPE